MALQSISQTVPSSKVLKRYHDAYRVAGASILMGTVAKVVGVVLALFVGIGGCMAAANLFRRYQEQDERFAMMAASVAVAILALGVFYIVGVLLCALGQLVRASLDGAVHSSPFLTDEEKVSAMRL